MEDSPPLGPRTSDHLVSAEEVCMTAFVRRNLMETPVLKWPHKGNKTMIADPEFMGCHTLKPCYKPDVFMAEQAVGVMELGKESWWVSSHGKWCPSY